MLSLFTEVLIPLYILQLLILIGVSVFQTLVIGCEDRDKKDWVLTNKKQFVSHLYPFYWVLIGIKHMKKTWTELK